MGIRVNKLLGYGLKDLRTKRANPKEKYSGHVPNDPRWDYKAYLADWHGPDGVDRERTLEQFLAFCEDKKDVLVRIMAAERGRTEEFAVSDHWLLTQGIKDRLKRKDAHWCAPYSAMEWDAEAGLKNVVMFTPAEHYHDWRRHDDTIDYYEETTLDGPRVRATFIKGSTGIYPHNGTMRRFRLPSRKVSDKLTGVTRVLQAMSHEFAANRELDGADICSLPGGCYNQLVGMWDPKRVPPVIKDPEVRKHFQEDWRPIVPMGVLALVEYLGCFPDAFGQDGIVNSLRPMICVVWR